MSESLKLWWRVMFSISQLGVVSVMPCYIVFIFSVIITDASYFLVDFRSVSLLRVRRVRLATFLGPTENCCAVYTMVNNLIFCTEPIEIPASESRQDYACVARITINNNAKHWSTIYLYTLENIVFAKKVFAFSGKLCVKRKNCNHELLIAVAFTVVVNKVVTGGYLIVTFSTKGGLQRQPAMSYSRSVTTTCQSQYTQSQIIESMASRTFCDNLCYPFDQQSETWSVRLSICLGINTIS